MTRGVRENERMFTAIGGRRLFERSWLPDSNPKAAVIIVHGYAEHSGRYQHVAERLVDNGYAVHAFDLSGHGRSDGGRAFVRSLDEHVADLRSFVARVRQEEPRLPLFLLGHSMGGTVVAMFLASGEPLLRGAILSGAGLKLPGGPARIVETLLSILGKLAPKWPLGKLRSEEISRDPAVVSSYDSDPLVYRGRMRAGTAAALIRAVHTVASRMNRITVPLLLLHGTADKLTDPDGSRELYKRANSRDKTLKLYGGFYHEVFNEPEKEQVLNDVVQWLHERAEAPVRSLKAVAPT
jgi:acylglycerol lipase